MTKGRAAKDRISPEAVQRLEQATGHRFADHERLDRALTHASARNKGGRDYERLEFLGDRVLGLCIAEMLFDEFQMADEGELSVRLNQLVNANTLAEVADVLGAPSRELAVAPLSLPDHPTGLFDQFTIGQVITRLLPVVQGYRGIPVRGFSEGERKLLNTFLRKMLENMG